jgi:hypothetical protein
MLRTSDFIRKEGLRTLTFAVIIAAIKILPGLFAMNKTGSIYQEYYVKPFRYGFADLLIVMVVVRLVVVAGQFYLVKRRQTEATD